MSERRLRVADVFRCGWADYDRTHAIAPYQAARAVRKLLRCRTAALGGQASQAIGAKAAPQPER